MEIYGSGMLNLGYLGGVYDAGTGLIYMGNGQYYDPSTGRFLTRGAKAQKNNPYSPWNSNPAEMLFAPIILIFMLFNGKKKKGGVNRIFQYLLSILLIVCSLMMIGMFITSPVLAYDGIDEPLSEDDQVLYDEFNAWFIEMGGPDLPIDEQYELVLEFCSAHVGNTYPNPVIYPGTTLRDAQINLCVDMLWDVPLYPDSYFEEDPDPDWIDMDYSSAENWYLPKASDMKLLYEMHIAKKMASNFTEFFGQMLSREVAGTYGSEFGKKIMEAAAIQIWNGGYSGDMRYCNDGPKRCVNGALNWLATYPESAWRQAGAHIHLGSAIDLYDLPTIDNSDNLYSINYVVGKGRARANDIGLRVLWDESIRDYTGDIADAPYHWGRPTADGAWWFYVFEILPADIELKQGNKQEEIVYYDHDTWGAVYTHRQWWYWEDQAINTYELTPSYVKNEIWPVKFGQ